MNTILRALAATGVATILAAPAQAEAPVITFVSTGVIADGRDDRYMFLEPGQAPWLAGLPYVLSLTIDTGTLETIAASETQTYLRNWGSTASVSAELRVNGKTFSWTIDNGNGEVGMNRAGEWFGERQDSAAVNVWGGDMLDGVFVEAGNRVWSDVTPFMGSVDPAQNRSLPVELPGVESLTYFSATHWTGDPGPAGPTVSTTFGARISHGWWVASPVPEPGQYAMLAAGLCALAVAWRRRPRCPL